MFDFLFLSGIARTQLFRINAAESFISLSILRNHYNLMENSLSNFGKENLARLIKALSHVQKSNVALPKIVKETMAKYLHSHTAKKIVKESLSPTLCQNCFVTLSLLACSQE